VNDEPPKLREMLERATAPGSNLPDDLDAETASLRKTWLAFDSLLEGASFPSGEPFEGGRAAPRRRRWPLALALAVAASLMVAAGAITLHRLLDRPNVPGPNRLEIAVDEPPPERRPVATAGEYAWNDPLDAEIVNVSQTLALVQADWYARTGDLGAIQRGLDQIRQDMKDGTL